MTEDPAALVALASTGLIGFGVASAAALKGWSEWLELKRLELSSGRRSSPSSSPLPRTEVAALKERVRRLESIANGGADC